MPLVMKRSFTYSCLLAIIFSKMILLLSCANIIPPGGGLRDSLPPKLVASLPKDSAINVTTQNITLTFDEYVTLQSASSTVIVSPNQKSLTLFDYKLRNVTIKFRDTLEPNTTYSLDFGDAIRDVNEGNIAKNFNYVFSTGNTIDNHTYGGKVILAETGKIDTALVVILHRNLSDTAVLKERPRYYTRLNGKGEFFFKHLPSGTFNVYAIPPNYLNTYADSTKSFAFKNTPVMIGANDTKRDTLFAYNAKNLVQKTATNSPVKLPGSNKEDKRLRYSVNLDNGQQDILINTVFTFNRKLGSFDSSKFVLTDTNYNPLKGYKVSVDSGMGSVTLKYPWKENAPMRILVAKDAVADTAAITLSKADTIRFFTKKEADYGSVRLRFGNLDLSKNPVLQIVAGDRIIESIPLTESEFRRKLFYAGSYDLRILYDKNKNGKWDPGEFSEKRQPEIVVLVPKPITIKANWDNEVNIAL